MALVPSAAFAAPPDSSSTPMETVVVQGQKLNVETRIDRKIYTVPEDAQTTLGALSDLLNVIPSVDVDPGGAVSLRGDTNVLILIDGKPATQLQGSKAGDNLQSIPASDIERIEILTTPPAQFKVEGAAGVINIITRKRGAKDWFKGIALGTDVVGADHEVQVHHIFPKALLREAGVSRKDRDEIANLAFLAAKPNRQISKRAPAVYLAEIAAQHPERLEAQCVPMDRDLWELEHFDKFLAARRDLLAKAVNVLLQNP